MLIRNVEIEGCRGLDVRVSGPRVVEIGQQLSRDDIEIDGRGGALLPGLHDHHVHILSTAARRTSVDLSAAGSRDAVLSYLKEAAATCSPGGWVRAVGFDEIAHGQLTRQHLDTVAKDVRIKVEHRTGSGWILNRRALESLCGASSDARQSTIRKLDRGLRTPHAVTRDALRAVGQNLVSHGITGVTDATESTDQESMHLLSEAVLNRDLPVKLLLMSGGTVDCAGTRSRQGPLKLQLDEIELPSIEWVGEKIKQARADDRNLAVHVLTAAELAFALACFATFGVRSGDRLEHAAEIPETAIDAIATLGLTVVTQPAFIADRGDLFRERVDPQDHDTLYRYGTLLERGISVASSSDAPYGPINPWLAIQAAATRKTREGHSLGPRERVAPEAVLQTYLTSADKPGAIRRHISVSEPADLCLLKTSIANTLQRFEQSPVRLTIVDGDIVYQAPGRPEQKHSEGIPTC